MQASVTFIEQNMDNNCAINFLYFTSTTLSNPLCAPQNNMKLDYSGEGKS